MIAVLLILAALVLTAVTISYYTHDSASCRVCVDRRAAAEREVWLP